MKTAKQTVKTEFEPIALGENVNVNFEQNVTGDHIVTRGYVSRNDTGEYLGNISEEDGNLTITLKLDDVGKEVMIRITPLKKHLLSHLLSRRLQPLASSKLLTRR